MSKYTKTTESFVSFAASVLVGLLGCLGILVLVYGTIFAVCMLLGLVAHVVFPQWGYWQETGLIFLVGAVGSMIFGRGGSGNA